MKKIQIVGPKLLNVSCHEFIQDVFFSILKKYFPFNWEALKEKENTVFLSFILICLGFSARGHPKGTPVLIE